MKHNNAKIEMIADVDRVMGLLITIRTVETSPLHSDHWVNDYIDSLSSIKYKAVDDQDECQACDGSGADYPPYAESIHDAEPCQECDGYGFNSNKELSKLLREISQNLESKGNTRVKSLIDEILTKPLYRV